MMKRLSMIASAFALVALVTVQATAKEITVRGRLAQTVEAGGWLVIVDTNKKTTKYLLLNANRFQRESWFRVGALVEARGEVKSDVMTIYQEGTPFEARTMRSIRKARARAYLIPVRETARVRTIRDQAVLEPIRSRECVKTRALSAKGAKCDSPGQRPG